MRIFWSDSEGRVSSCRVAVSVVSLFGCFLFWYMHWPVMRGWMPFRLRRSSAVFSVCDLRLVNLTVILVGVGVWFVRLSHSVVRLFFYSSARAGLIFSVNHLFA